MIFTYEDEGRSRVMSIKKRALALAVAFAVTAAGVLADVTPASAAAKKIASAEDLLAMEDNPTGSYYLAGDITVPENTCLFAGGTPFMGTLDGRGHRLKGYKSTESPAIFDNARFATFKNLTVANVDIRVEGPAAGLVNKADTVTFRDVAVSGNIVSSGEDGNVGGIVASGSGSLAKCKSSAKIVAKDKEYTTRVGGLAGDFSATSLKDCTNSGAVTLETTKKTYTFGTYDDAVKLTVCGLAAGMAETVSGCKNSGNVTAKLNYSIDEKASGEYLRDSVYVYTAGICREVKNAVKSSGNTGSVKVSAKQSGRITGEAYVAGLVDVVCEYRAEQRSVSGCYNTGNISFTGALSGKSAACSFVGGLFAKSGYGVKECYNKGKVTVSYYKNHTGVSKIGGVFGDSYGASITNCYNTGSVSVTDRAKKNTSKVYAGGLGGAADVLGKTKSSASATCNYSTGALKCTKDVDYGLVIGKWSGPFLANKRLIYDNYYTGSGKAYGSGDTTWEPYRPTAKKVSAITSGNCPKLSSKYWTYSSKYKRLVLKNNKES